MRSYSILSALVLINATVLAENVELPDVLTMNNGEKVSTAKEWMAKRRPEILEWYRTNLYGRAPLGRPEDMTFEVFESDTNALNGTATRKQVRVDFTDAPDGPCMNILIYIPNDVPRPVPVFVGLNKEGNQTVHKDSNILKTTKWNKPGHPKRQKRGAQTERWQVEEILSRGYAVATAHCSDLDPDVDDGFKNGVHGVFDPIYYPDGRPDDAWGTIAAWAWGLSRIIDYLETDPDIDQERVATIGLSRRGKASLWCGAQDQRVALTISSDSCGQGSSLARLLGGIDTIKHLNNYAPHWFCKNWNQYNDRDKEVPVDQHMLIALVAPRLVYVASSSGNRWAYPIRDFLAVIHAAPVWELLGYEGIDTQDMPEPNVPLHEGRMGYHIRKGSHGLTEYDWKCYMDFADRHWKKESDELQNIRSRMEELLLKDLSESNQIDSLVKQMGKDGRWPDIDYESKNRASWSVCSAHLGRVFEIAKAYRAPEHPLHGDERLLGAVNLALRDWVKHDYRNPNWWYASIGVPQLMGRICILMENDMDRDILETCRQRHLSRTRAKGQGQNKIWTAEVVLYGGVLAKDPELVQYAAETILSELHLTTKQGLQHDWSFHLHGPQNQIGTYGSAFSTDMAKWAYVYEDTRLAFSGDQFALLRNFLLKGQGWVAWNGILDINCRGRTVGRLSATSRYDYLLPAARLMRKIDPQHADGYTAYIKRNSGGANDLIGNKHFWRSDLMVHRARNWYASVRMCSTRTIGGESCNNENLRGRYAADGVLLLYTTGREYEDIFPVWNWRKLPGLTGHQASDRLEKPHRLPGTTNFVGGVTDGVSGIGVLDYARDGLAAKKAWFFLENAIVCMGTGIRSDTNDPVTTSVNQCLLKGEVIKGPQWYWHDSVGYFFSSPQEVVLQCGPQKGNWRQISELEYLIDEEVAKDVFSLWIDHGEKPQDGKYAYVLFPGITAEETAAKVKHNRILVLRNDSDCQAVADGAEKKTLIAFRKPGNIDIGYERKLAVDQPCLIIAAEMERGLKLSIADPTQTLGIVNVEITGEKSVAVQLPAGPYRGQSVSIDLFKRRRRTDVQ